MNRRRWGLLMMVIGVALLAFSLGQYGYMAWSQHRLHQQWQQHERTQPATHPLARPLAAPPQARGHVASYEPGNDGASGLRLVIPSIHLDDIVVRGTDYDDLLIAPGLLDGTPLPAEGGNTVIAGHRDTFFRHISDLAVGDRIQVYSGGREYDYLVSGRRIVSPDETSVLDNTVEPRLTLVTCYPTYWIGPAPKRLIVRATPAP